MATLTRQNINEGGAVLTFVSAAGGGDVVDNSDGQTILHINNQSGGSITVTITAQDTNADNFGKGALTKANASIIVTTLGIASIGPFAIGPFNNGSNQIAITYSGVTSLTVATASYKRIT